MNTSAALLTLLLAAVASAQLGVKPNNQYEYRFVAKIVTGIPELSSQWSGMGLRATLLVQAPTADVVQFKLRDTEMAELHNKVVDMPWHQSFPMDWQPVTDVKQILEQPFKIKLTRGKIVELVVGGNEPETLVNMKKAIVQRWQMTMNKDVITDFPSGKFFEDETQPLYFEAEEETIGGVCKTGYIVTPILEPQTQLETIQSFGVDVKSHWKWTVEDVPKELKTKRFEITKNILHDKCSRRPIFQHMSPAPIYCSENVTDCFNINANSTTTIRYLIRGQRKSFEIEAINAIGVHLTFPLQATTEQLTTATNQTMILVKTSPIASPFPEPPSPRTLKQISASVLTKDLITPERTLLPKPSLTDRPIINMAWPNLPLHRMLQKRPIEEMKQQALRLITSLDATLDQVPNPDTRDAPGMLAMLQSVLHMMSMQDLEEIYGQIDSVSGRNTDVMKKMFRETVALTGTNPCIMMVKKWIEAKEVVGTEAATLTMFIPMHIKTPTVEILQEVFKLLRNGIAQNDEHLRHNTMLSFARTVNIACISKFTTDNAFPVTMFEGLCHPKVQQITQAWIPFFTKRMTEDVDVREKMVVLKAMSLLQHPDVVPTLMEFATKKDEDVHVREAAIYGMMKLVWVDRVLVERVVKPIAMDKNEFFEVRMAAIIVLMSTNAPLSTYQQLALSTWTERDEQMVNYISSFLEESANLTSVKSRWMREISEKSRLVFRLTRPTRVADLWTRDTIVRSSVEFLQTAGDVTRVGMVSPFQTTPSMYSMRTLSYGHHHFVPLVTVMKFTGFQNVIDMMMAPDSDIQINRFRRGPTPVQDVISELNEIKNLLKTVKRENEDMLYWLQVTVMNMDRLFTFDKSAIQTYLQGMLMTGTYKLEVKNFQKVMNLLDHVVGVPTDVGIPMMITRSAPGVLSIRGDIVLETKRSNDGSMVARLDMKRLHPFFDQKLFAMTAVVNPLTRRMMGAGVDCDLLISLPITASIEYDSKSKRLELFTNFLNAPREINLVRVESRPFTTAYSLETVQSPIRHSPDTKPIQVRPPTINEARIGKDLLGIDLALVFRSQDDHGRFMDMVKRITVNTIPGTILSVMPTMRPDRTTLVLDTGRATTKKMIVSLAWDKFKRHHTMETINNPEAEPVERIEWLGDKPQYRDEQHAAVEKDARREVMKRSRKILQQIHTGKVTGLTAVVSCLGMKERRIALKWLTVRDATRRNIKRDIRLTMLPTEDIPMKRELLFKTHITWPQLPKTLDELLISDIYAPLEADMHLAVNDTVHRIATFKGALKQTEEYRQWASQNRLTRECRENKNRGFEHAPVCETAKIKASRLNKFKIDIDINEKVDDTGRTPMAILGVENLIRTNMDTIRKTENVLSYSSDRKTTGHKSRIIGLVARYLVNKLAKFPWFVKPTQLTAPSQRRVVVEFNPIYNTWSASLDNGEVCRVVEDIRPDDTYMKTNGVYNRANGFGLSIPFLPFLNIRDGINGFEDDMETELRREMGDGKSKCVIDERFIKTFDNKTMSLEMAEGCWHLVAQDCSEVNKLAVLVKPTGVRKAVKIITSSKIIELLPNGLDFYLQVDKKESRRLPVGELLMLETNDDRKEPVARILKTSADVLEIELPQYESKVKIVRNTVEVLLKPMYFRNKVCGVCGNMDGESSQDLIGPKRCLFFDAKEFQAAYMADSSCRKTPLPNYGDNCIKVKREHWMH